MQKNLENNIYLVHASANSRANLPKTLGDIVPNLKVLSKTKTANQEHLHDELFREQLARTGENVLKQTGRQCVLKIGLNF